MANAATKKAAAAKSSAAGTYNKILLATNAVYLLLLFGQFSSVTVMQWIAIVTNWGFQLYAYMGILDQASAATNRKASTDLVGGSHLDLLAVTWLVQFGTTLLSSKCYWIVALIPPWVIYTIYTQMKSPSTDDGNSNAAGDDDAGDDGKNEKREKRAEKRRKKWS